MPHQRAFELFNLKNTQELRDFSARNMENAQKRGYNWVVDEKSIRFEKIEVSQFNKQDAENTMISMLNYVNEIDKIV